MPAGVKCRDILNGKYRQTDVSRQKTFVQFQSATKEQLKIFNPTKLPFRVIQKYNNHTQSCGGVIVSTIILYESYESYDSYNMSHTEVFGSLCTPYFRMNSVNYLDGK